MKRYTRFIVFIALAMMLISPAFARGTKDDGVLTIGISKIVAHYTLDPVEQGIQDELAALGYTGVVYDLQNANGDPNTAASIANKFKASGVDIAVGIGTPAAQALANGIDKIPVIYTAVTDPLDAGLVDSYTMGGANITGVSDLTPVKEQIELLTKCKVIKRLGHVYSSGEANAVRLAKIARETCAKLGIEFVETTVTNSAEVKAATQSIIGRVDGIYVSTDNTVLSAVNSLIEVAMENGVPVMSADASSFDTFEILAAYGLDYYRMGRFTGSVIDRVLKGESTASIPTQYMTNASDLYLRLNLDVAKKLGLKIPEEVLAEATIIVDNYRVISK